jgi:hypothetical protein
MTQFRLHPKVTPGAKATGLPRCGLRGANEQTSTGESAMNYYETQQQNPMHNPQFNPQHWTPFSPQFWQGAGSGLGQAAYGQQYGQYGAQPPIGAFGHNVGWGSQPQGWGQQQRQLSQNDVGEVVRQLLPALPQILAQAQQSPASLGYAAYGQTPRLLSQQDVNEVVRQILPFVPQIAGMLQGQPQFQSLGMQGNPFGLHGSPQFQSAFGGPTPWGQPQRQLTQQDVADITRQLVGIIPQVIGNLQTLNQNQQRMI